MKGFLKILLLSIGPYLALGQSFTVYNYAVPEGLPSSEVYEVFQDRKGFLWFATDNGVVKFDGSQMEVFQSKQGLSDPVVFSFHEDKFDRIWFRTFSHRLFYYENGTVKKYKYNDLIKSIKNNSGVIHFAVTDRNELWFTLRNRIAKIDSLGNLTSSNVTGTGLYYKDIDDHTHVIGSSNGKYPVDTIIVNDQSFKVNVTPSRYQNRVNCVLPIKNTIFFSINRDIFLFKDNAVQRIITGDFEVISLSVDREENLWIGYLNGGTQRFDTKEFKHSFSPKFLEDKSVTKVYQDHEGGYWFSTLESGVFHVPNLLIEHFQLSTASRIKSILKLGREVLVGDQAGKLMFLDMLGKNITRTKFFAAPLISMYHNRNNRFIVSTHRIEIFDDNFNLLNSYQGIANDFCEEKNGDVWACGSNRILRFNQEGELLSQSTHDLPFRTIETCDSLLILAEHSGLHLLDRSIQPVTQLKQFAESKVSNIQHFDDSLLLISTIGRGFSLLNTKTWKSRAYNTSNNFLSDNIYSSLITSTHLWLGTEKGLIKIPIKGLHDKTLSFEYLTKKSGLVNDKIDFLLPVDSTIWAFSDRYFSTIPVSFSKFANRQPIFYIQEVTINDKIVPVFNSSQLKHDQNNIQIAFGFISFNNPNIILRYRLSNTEQWIYTQSKKLVFSSLAPGQYTFALEYSTDNAQWTSVPTLLSFYIDQPWWNKWYIQLSALILLIILGYLYFLYQQSIYRQKHHYLKIINDHQQRLIQSEIVTLERERNRISKELHDRVGTNLTAIKLMVSQLLRTYKEPLAKDVEDQFQIAIGEIKEIIYGLTPPSLERYGLFTGLKNYIGKLNKTIPIAIALKTYGKEIHKYELNIIVFRVLQELLTNSIKHSFAKNITVHINSFEDVLNVVYEDDGIGFQHDPLQNGLGLDNIESRIHSVQGTLKFESGKFGISYTIDIPINLNKEVV